MVHVSGKHGSGHGIACADRADEPWNLEDACPSYKRGEAVPGKIHDLAGACGDPGLDDDGNVLYKRCNCVTDAGL